jgi:hypothetical protein
VTCVASKAAGDHYPNGSAPGAPGAPAPAARAVSTAPPAGKPGQ